MAKMLARKGAGVPVRCVSWDNAFPIPMELDSTLKAAVEKVRRSAEDLQNEKK